MNTNRLISRKEAASLDLQSRIKLEIQLTEAEAAKATLQDISPNWQFKDYRDRSPWRRYLFDFLGPLKGRTILDLGCGYNPTPIYFALAGARKVYACDVSPKAVTYVQDMAQKIGVADRVSVFVSAGEQLPLANETIDLVHGEAVLHHLCFILAGPEIARVLKRGGKAALKDPLGHNPVLEVTRDYLPYRWKASAKGTDQPLKFSHIEKFGQNFAFFTYHGFAFLSMIVTFILGRGNSKPRKIADNLDGYILRMFPILQRYCRFVVTCVQK